VPLLVRRAVRATREPGSVSGPVATVGRSPWSAPFPPQTPRAASCLCSPVSSVLWSCLTPRKRTRRTCGIAPSPTDPPLARRMFPGPPGFREESFQPCTWSQTPWGRRRACHERSTSLLPSPCQDKVGHRREMISELNTRPGCASVNASPKRLPAPAHHSRPRRLARSYLVRLFHSRLSSGLCRRTLTPFFRRNAR
jgi:hypothetical protein